MKIAYIRWLDACTEEADSPHSEVTPGLVELREVGFLLGENERAVTIGMEFDGEAAPGRFRLHIPRNSIQEMKVVEVATFLRARDPKPRRKKVVPITEGK